MSIDCHCHFDESIVSVPGLIASMDGFGIQRTALIPALNEDLEMTFFARFGTPLFRKALVSRSGILSNGARAMYASWVKDDGTVDLGGKRYEVKEQPDNDPVAKAVRNNPDRFCGWIFVNPAGPADPVAEVERLAGIPGMIGVKTHPFWHNYEVSRLVDAAALAKEKGLAMLLHLGTGEKGEFKLLPEEFPELKVVYAHAGVPYQEAVCEYARGKKNVYVDLSSTAYVDPVIASMAVEKAGAEKCVFGSDGPYFHHKDDRLDLAPHLDMISRLSLPKDKEDGIMSGNFREITGA